MPVTYEIQGTLLRLNFEGTYEPDDIVQAFLDALADPRAPARVALLVDVSRSDSLTSRSPDEIRMVAEFLGPHAEWIGGRCAVIAESALAFGFSRMGSVYSGKVGVEAQVFRDAESALAWLGVSSKV
jgi:hypothetical protein